jgi:glycosyltransferase involved in cell wall biosynthesis
MIDQSERAESPAKSGPRAPEFVPEVASRDTPSTLHRGRPLRVLHGVYELAGQGMMLARALAGLGCDARSFSYQVAWDGRVSDIVVDLGAYSGNLAKGVAMSGAFARWASRFDVFHFHFGTSFLPRRLDVPLLAAMGKTIVYHFHGCEVRNRAHMLMTHSLATCTECDPFCRPVQQAKLLADMKKHASRAYYSTLDLAESIPGALNLPLAIEADRWEAACVAHPLPEPERRDGVRGPVVIAHAPTNRLIKGTRHLVEAVERLSREFPLIELRMIEQQPWAEMPAFLSRCDILVDQLMMGWYGLLSIEGMAERRPVIAYIRDDFRPLRPELPVVSAEPATIESVLRELIRDPARRAGLGEQGNVYVRRHHDLPVVGRMLLADYQRMLHAR